MSNSQAVSATGTSPDSDQVVPRPVLLRQSREAAGLHIAALAAALKVPVKKLEALEAGRYEELPDMTFARALASSACRHLKIDTAPVLAQIPLGHAAKLGDSPQAINAPFRNVQDPAPFNPMGWLSRPAVLGAIALLLAALVLVFLPVMETSPVNDAVMPAATSVTEPISSRDPVPPAEAQVPAVAAAPAVPAPAVTAAVNLALPAMTTSLPVEASATMPVLPSTGSLLSIAATDETWVKVVNGSGATVMQRMLKAGDVIDFSTAPPYTVVLGRAEAAQVTVRDKPFDLAPYTRNGVARFEAK